MSEPEVEQTATKMAKWWEATKTMLLPFAILVSVIFTVVIFAGEQWVRGIAREEIGAGAGTDAAGIVAEHATRLTKVEGDVENNDEEIEDNEEDIDEVEKSVREFMRDLINKL